jgi:hypothetical protein
MIFTTAAGYPIVYPGGAFRKSLTEFWLQKTVPKDYDHLIVEVKSNEAPGSWWNRLNSSLSYQNVNFPTVSWAGLCLARPNHWSVHFSRPSHFFNCLSFLSDSSWQAGMTFSCSVSSRAFLPISTCRRPPARTTL